MTHYPLPSGRGRHGALPAGVTRGKRPVSKVRTSKLLWLVPLGLVATLTTSCSSSPSPGATPATTTLKVATGAVTCTGVTGMLTFSPPLTTKGAGAESTGISLKAAGCTTKGSNVAAVAGATATATISSPTSSCTGLLNSRVLTIDITWSPATIHQSVLTFTGYGGTTSSSGGLGFTLPKVGDTAKVIGSFAGSDHGAGSTGQAFSGQTGTQLLTACGSSAGLASIQVTSGTLDLK